MKTKKQNGPMFSTDIDGQKLTRIGLTNTDRQAVMYAEDFQRILDAGFSTSWKYNENGSGSGYPTLSAFSPEGYNREVALARLVADAPRGQCVRTIDGDNLNLRRDNLEFVRGAVWYGASDWSPTASALRASGAEPASKETRFDRRTRRVKHLFALLPPPAVRGGAQSNKTPGRGFAKAGSSAEAIR